MNRAILILLCLGLYGCATTNMVYVNPEKTAKEIEADKRECQAIVDASDSKDEDLRQKKFNQCMKEKGYKPVPEKEVGRVKGFKETRVDPDTNFKVYEVIFIDKVDVSQVKVKNSDIAGSKVTDEDIDNLGQEMGERFSKTLNILMPVVTDKESASGKKALFLKLVLKDIAFANAGFNAVVQAASSVSRVPLPVSSEGLFSFEGTITDFSNTEKLITVSDESKSDKNASLVGFENFQRWQHAYNTMDYWADCLTSLLAAKRGQKYKSQLKMKVF